MFRNLFMSSTMPGGNDVKKPKLECPCGYMSESEYEKVRRGTRANKHVKRSTFHRRWEPFYGKSIWLASQDCHGIRSRPGDVLDGTICQAIEHARYHREWDAKRTTQGGEIFVFHGRQYDFTKPNCRAKTHFLKIHELKYGTHLEPEQLFALKRSS
ncbi:hypothetical protein BV898_15139 [Hypsibius exemplaris]|uniref:Uncharacterized protein n=1 Tax=Hypsibius exemplaris TaxID=2072580 RepID=A0A9X6RK33_HYPEX|nr:hypothetical protein BV898_15139 [Hypsibius exemplaris]